MLRKYTLFLAGFLGLILGSVGCGDTHSPAGYLEVWWNLDSRTYGGTSCERANINLITLGAHNARTGKDYYTDFNCVDYHGISYGEPVGDYTVALYAYAPGDDVNPVAGTALPVTYPVDPDYTTPVPTISIVVP